jgi:hypothetical protein
MPNVRGDLPITCDNAGKQVGDLHIYSPYGEPSLRLERVVLLGIRRDSALLSAHLSTLGVDPTTALATGALVIVFDADTEGFFSLASSGSMPTSTPRRTRPAWH